MSALAVLIAYHRDDLLNILDRIKLSDNYALLHAKTPEEAIVLLNRLNAKIDLATSELPDDKGWDSINLESLGDEQVQIIPPTWGVSNELVRASDKALTDDALNQSLSQEESQNTTITDGWRLKVFLTLNNKCVVQMKAHCLI